MGHKQKTTLLDVQKQKIKAIFNALLDTNIAIMQFQMTLTSDKNDIKGIKDCKPLYISIEDVLCIYRDIEAKDATNDEP